MSAVDRLWAGWRSEYVSSSEADVRPGSCVFCELLSSSLPDEETHVVWRDGLTAAMLNAYPYGTGHLLIMPVRHVGELEELYEEEAHALWSATREAAAALKRAYRPDGLNLGANLGASAGAGIPGHLHMHALPRWKADTNFMSSVANARVLPEALELTWTRLREAWPAKQ